MGRSKTAEVGYQGAHSEVPLRHDALDANRKCIVRFSPLHVDGARLGIEELGRGKGAAREIFLLRYPALEGIFGVDRYPFSKLYCGYGLPIRVEDIAVVPGDDLHRVALV